MKWLLIEWPSVSIMTYFNLLHLRCRYRKTHRSNSASKLTIQKLHFQILCQLDKNLSVHCEHDLLQMPIAAYDDSSLNDVNNATLECNWKWAEWSRVKKLNHASKATYCRVDSRKYIFIDSWTPWLAFHSHRYRLRVCSLILVLHGIKLFASNFLFVSHLVGKIIIMEWRFRAHTVMQKTCLDPMPLSIPVCNNEGERPWNLFYESDINVYLRRCTDWEKSFQLECILWMNPLSWTMSSNFALQHLNQHRFNSLGTEGLFTSPFSVLSMKRLARGPGMWPLCSM